MTLEIVRGHPKPPIGGWSFYAHNQTFRGHDADEVIERVTHYRTQNSLPLGNPEAELAAQYAETAPHLVKEGDTPTDGSGARQRVAEHTMAIQYGKYERRPVHDPIVQDRLACCATCLYREQEFREPATLYWNDAATKAALMTSDMACEQKGWCSAHYELLALFTRLVSPEKVATLPAPACCWLKAS